MRKLFVWLLLPLVVSLFAPAGVATNAARAAPQDVNGPLEEAGGEEAAEEHAEEGPPLSFDPDLATWSLIAFVIFAAILAKFAWKPLASGLNAREARIREDIAAAETLRRNAEQMLAEHQKRLDAVQDEVREIIAEARRDAEYTKQDIIETAQREAETTRQRAIADIGRARDGALKDLFETMTGQVADATEHVLGRSVTDQDQDRLIREALAGFTPMRS